MIPKHHPLPTNLKTHTPHPNSPWLISQDLFNRLNNQPASDKPFRIEEVSPNDPEAKFVHTYFCHQQPLGYTIRQILCIHNPSHSLAFENEIKNIELESNKFAPEGRKEEPKQEREQTIQRFEEVTQHFSPIEIQGSKRTDRFVKTKILPLWQGTSQDKCESICSSGFTYFGKHHCFHAAAKQGPQASIDIGYFGSGIYFTNSAKYATMYSEGGNLLLSWVSMREPYPVVSDVPHPKKCTDMTKLEGKGAYQNYNAHYIPVASINPQDPDCMQYFPCHKNQPPACDEIVVFQKAQTLPRFWVKITKDTIPNLLPNTLNQEWEANLLKAKQGDPTSQYYIGLCFSLGHTIPQDDHSAFSWFQQSAIQNYPPAQYTLSFCHLHGKGTNQDTKQAIHWAEKAAQSKTLNETTFPSQLAQAQTIHQLAQVQFLESSDLSTQLEDTQDDLIITRRQMNQIKEELDRVKQELAQAKLKKPEAIPIIQPKIVVPQPQVVQLPQMAFGKAKWATHFGDIGEEPPLPQNIHQILSAPCPFWPTKKVQETHMLVLIPKTVNGQPLTLKNLAELIKKPKQGHATQFCTWHPGGNENIALAKSYWVLMTRDVIEGTRNKSYADQVQIVSQFSKKAGTSYEVPKLLEAGVCILMEYVSQGARLYSDNPCTYTGCQEKYAGSNDQMIIGGFAVGGPVVNHVHWRAGVNDGLASLRKF